MVAITANFELSGLQRAAKAFGSEQMPFAQALALTRLAQGVAEAEAEAVRETFDNPTPFTQKSFSVKPATKKTQIAFVRAKDIAARYLAPYVFGGERSLGAKKAMLVPRNVTLNQYGNLSRNKIASLKGKKNVFVGQVKTKKGKMISGVWQRPAAAPAKGRKGTPASPSGLTLLVQFEDTTPAPKHFPFHERAQAYVAKHAKDEFTAALRQAFDTARRGRRR